MSLRVNIFLNSKQSFAHLLAGLTIIGLLYSCNAEIDPPSLSTGNADFSSVIALGGDFLAGYENGALSREGQQNSIPKLLSLQFNEVYSQTGMLNKVSSFKQPLMPIGQGFGLNSKKWESEFISPVTLGYKVDCKGVESLSPLKNLINLSGQSAGLQYLIDGGYQNLAVPSAKMADIIDPNFGLPYSQGNSNPFYGRFASDPGTSTILQDVLNLSPSFSLIWVGMEDIYGYASAGGYNKIIPSATQFAAELDVVLSALTANGSKGAIANIPSLSAFPFFSTIPYNSAVLDFNKRDSLNDYYESILFPDPLPEELDWNLDSNGFMIADANTTYGFRHLEKGESILISAPLDSMKCFKMGTVLLLPKRHVLLFDQKVEIENAITSYNQAIAAAASTYGLALVDMNAFFKTLQDGVQWNGEAFNPEFVSGGFFSLDGYHPNQKGYGMLANEFIKAINKKFTATVPTTNCTTCVGIKFP